MTRYITLNSACAPIVLAPVVKLADKTAQKPRRRLPWRKASKA